ncbi:MAG: hypothetical protein V2G51_06200 [bacterium JZ-2024 1]
MDDGGHSDNATIRATRRDGAHFRNEMPGRGASFCYRFLARFSWGLARAGFTRVNSYDSRMGAR